ncbi:hypothetical protein OnM2_063053 [Erysiphe neolycopersici]|uniref:Uncharacterized protein n=1 Tax=Erysiphe neolycopersici TaxID=212602 RepID=A0A420HNT8_9PEZI|nr:hypothetical protein OnM2_063053 [Erysiphe neolycopersici]
MSSSSQIRSIYRSFLRELPPIRKAPPTTIFKSTLVKRIRSSLTSSSSPNKNISTLQQAEQFLQYLRAQNTYVSLLNKYNSNTGMDQSEKIRLTARRVGMELPASSSKYLDET